MTGTITLSYKEAADLISYMGLAHGRMRKLTVEQAEEPQFAMIEGQELLMAKFPGGYVGYCSCCDEPQGKHEVDPTCDGIVCFDCIEAGRDLPTITPAQEPELA